MLVDKKTSVTLVQLVGWGSILVSGALTGAGIYYALTSRVDASDNKIAVLTEKIERLDRNSSAIAILPLMQEKLEQLSIANTQAMSKISDTNIRMDRVVDSINGKLDTNNDKQTNILVQIGVLGAKLDRVLTQDGDRAKPAILRRVVP